MLSVAPLPVPKVPAGWKLALALAFRDKGHKASSSLRGKRPMSMSNLPPILEEPEPLEFEDAIETFAILQDICNTRISISVARPAIQTRSSSCKQTSSSFATPVGPQGVTDGNDRYVAPTVEFDSLSLVTTPLLIAPGTAQEPQPDPIPPRDHSTHRPPAPARDLRDPPATLTSPPPSRAREVSTPVQNVRRAGGKRRRDPGPDAEDSERGIGAASKRRRTVTTPPMATIGAHPDTDTSRNIVASPTVAGNRIPRNRRRRAHSSPVRQQLEGAPPTPSPASATPETHTRTPPGRGLTGKRKRSFRQDCNDDDGAAEDEDASRYAKTRRAPFW